MAAQDRLPFWLRAAETSAHEVVRSLGRSLTVTCEDPESDQSSGLSGAYVPIDSEEHTYLIALVTTPSAQYRLTQALLGGAVESESPLYVRDAMGEISNMMAGGTKSRVARVAGYDLTLGLPMFIRGEYLGTSTARTRIQKASLKIDSDPAFVIVIEQQVSGEAVRRRQVERQLRDSEERQRAIIEAAPDAVITASLEGEVLSFNSAAERAFGTSAEQVIGRSVTTLLKLPFAIGEEAAQNGEGTGLRSDGSRFPVDVSASAFRFRESMQVALIVRDITQREVARKDLEVANQRLIDVSHAAGKAEVAADVLHNVGNVLNSINTTTTLLTESLKRSKLSHLEKGVGLLSNHERDLVNFFSQSQKARKLVPFLRAVTEELAREKAELSNEVESLQKHIDHIKRVIMTQQLIASATGVSEEVDLDELIDDALFHARMLIEGAEIEIENLCRGTPTLITDKNKVLQIIINLIKNACEALGEQARGQRLLKLSVETHPETLTLRVQDSGSGIAPEVMDKLFGHGFTTKKDGHGFGLHGCALHAKQLGGHLSAYSEGVGRGATFTLVLPRGQRRAGTIQITSTSQAPRLRSKNAPRRGL